MVLDNLMVKCKTVNFESESSSLSPGAYKSPYNCMGTFLFDIRNSDGIIKHMARSSSGLGYKIFTLETRFRLPYGL